MDIRPDTLNIDETLIERAITRRTKAIFPSTTPESVAKWHPILDIARKYDLRVVEDAAQGVNAFHNNRALGSIGHMGAFSFHETKNVICGEGGALCISDPSSSSGRKSFATREPTENSSSAAWSQIYVGRRRLELCPERDLLGLLVRTTGNGRRDHGRTSSAFPVLRAAAPSLEEEGLLRTPHIPANCRSSYHLFYIILPDQARGMP